MKLVEINWSPSHRQLRQFAVICLVALPLIGWIWGANWQAILALGVIAAAIGVVGLIVPQRIRPIFLALMIVALPIGLVIGELAMLAIYFGVFLPIGTVFRAIGRDALQRRIEPAAPTYWQAKQRPKGASSYYRQS